MNNDLFLVLLLLGVLGGTFAILFDDAKELVKRLTKRAPDAQKRGAKVVKSK